MTSFTYSQWLGHMQTILNVQDPDGITAFTGMASYFIERGEALIYADPDLDFLATRDTDTSQQTVRGVRSVPIPAQLITVEGINLITPANTLPGTPGITTTRIPLVRRSRQFCDQVWPVETAVITPDSFNDIYFAIFDMEQTDPAPGEDEPSPLPSSFIIAPTMDDSYRLEVTGTFRPAALSNSNTTSFLTAYYYPLFLAATLVVGFGYQQNFGARSDNPQTAISWQDEFEQQKTVAIAQSLRQKAQVGGYSPVAMPMTGRVAAALGAPAGPPQGPPQQQAA